MIEVSNSGKTKILKKLLGTYKYKGHIFTFRFTVYHSDNYKGLIGYGLFKSEEGNEKLGGFRFIEIDDIKTIKSKLNPDAPKFVPQSQKGGGLSKSKKTPKKTMKKIAKKISKK